MIARRSWWLAGAAGALALVATGVAAVDGALARRHAGLQQEVMTIADGRSSLLLRRLSSAIDLSVLTTSDLPGRYVMIRWQGYWILPDDGTIRFRVLADDTASIWIDGRLVHDQNVEQGVLVGHESVALSAGAHQLRIEYRQFGGGSLLSLDVSVGGAAFVPLRPEFLMAAQPGPADLARARRHERVASAVSVIRVAALLAVLVLVLYPLLDAALEVAGRRLRALGEPRAGAGWLRERASGLWVLALVSLSGWVLIHRWAALDPATLWADDIWVAALAARPSLIEAVTTPAPVPPGFVLLQWIAWHLTGGADWSVQVVPLAAALALPALTAVVAHRLTGSRAAGVTVGALVSLDPFLAQLSVLGKQYATDACLAVALLLFVLPGRAGTGRLWRAAGLGCFAFLFSFPSAFVGGAVVLACAARGVWRARPWHAASALATYVAGMSFIYAVVHRPRANATIVEMWQRSFLSVGPEQPMTEVAYRLAELASQGLPAGGGGLAWLAVPGAVWLLREAGTRPAGAALLLSFLGLLAAAALGWYPMGIGYEGRVALFADPLMLLLVGIGAGALVTGVHLRAAVRGLSAVAAVVLAFARPVHVSYFDHGHSAMVEDLTRRARPADGVVLNSRASYLVGVYAGWPSAIRRDDSPEQFHLVFDRHGTLTLSPRAEETPDRLADLPFWLARFGYRRVFVFSIRRETQALEDLMRDAGFRATAETRSTTGAVLVEYRRGG